MGKFSDFIRNATPEEKEAVYMEVMKKATERQNAVTDGLLEPTFIQHMREFGDPLISVEDCNEIIAYIDALRAKAQELQEQIQQVESLLGVPDTRAKTLVRKVSVVLDRMQKEISIEHGGRKEAESALAAALEREKAGRKALENIKWMAGGDVSREQLTNIAMYAFTALGEGKP